MNWWQYLLLVNIYLVLFYAFYVLLLRKETFFQLNRVYLVTAALLSFFIPLIQAEWVRNLFITQQVKYTIYSSPVMIYGFKPMEATHINIGQVLTVLYCAGILFLSVRLIWQLVKLKRVISQPKANVTYSFFKKIKLDEGNPGNTIIEAHEQVHAQQWHSADVLLIELIMIINWFNPIVYLYRFAIKHIHEYIADRQAVQAGTNKADYALLLLSQTFNTPAHQLVNPFFNHSLLKQRIIMLQKNRSQRMSLIKYGLSAPLFILMLILSSATINNSKPVTVINSRAHQLFLTPARPAALGAAFSDEKKLSIVKLKSTAPEVKETTVVDIADTIKKIYTSVEQVPEFPGGLNALGRFLGTNIRYPKAEREKGIQGRVIATFVVETDGSLSNLEIRRGVSKGLDDESLRVLRLSPKWKPGTQNGENVRVQYSIPISFTLADSKGIKPGTDKKTNVEEGNKDGNTFTTADSSQGKNKIKISFRDSKSDPATQPLYIVDGKTMDQFNIKDINANNIQSINVLKGEAATAIYGDKGANGVILITSKGKAKAADAVKNN